MVVLTELFSGSPSSSSTHDHNHNHNQDYRYDVFLSFRGADTRNRFTDHLYNALVDADINTFLDDEEIETGEPLKRELESAIKSSRASIIVLSKNYAFSTWCLDELVSILEQKRNFNQVVIPVFYDVEPTNVRKQQSSFGEAMAKHRQRMEAETNAEKRCQWGQKMELWKRALTQVADLKGKDAKDRIWWNHAQTTHHCLDR
uniref:Putative toll/interleukin-1 receptor (TIR) domain-containing protein n=1 Tax=Helianthus annuus TaxID=4232 RepID=A0A251SSX0_HELAN